MYKEKPLSKIFSISHKSARIGFLFSAWVRSGLNLGCPGRAIFDPYNKIFFGEQNPTIARLSFFKDCEKIEKIATSSAKSALLTCSKNFSHRGVKWATWKVGSQILGASSSMGFLAQNPGFGSDFFEILNFFFGALAFLALLAFLSGLRGSLH